MTEEYKYQPGVCNINQVEISARRKTGYLALAGGLVALAAVNVINLSPLLGLILFLPFWVSTLGFLQAKNKFCVNYGANNKHNSGQAFGETMTTKDAADQAKDQQKTRQIYIKSAWLAGLATAVSMLILYFI